MLERLVAGLEAMHDDQRRQDFLRDLGGGLDEVGRWMREVGIDGKVSSSHAPTFLHGGSSTRRWLVMGINPGADDQSLRTEEVYKRQSPDNYVAFHEAFFEHFPRLRRNAKQPWWSKLYRVMRAIDGVVGPSVPVPWRELHTSPWFVVQDLVPFHGRTSKTLASRDFEGGVLKTIADATIAGIARSNARAVLVLSRRGFEILRRRHDVTITTELVLRGTTTTGQPRTVDAYAARLGAVPLLAIDNELASQPSFPYDQMLPQIRDTVRAHIRG